MLACASPRSLYRSVKGSDNDSPAELAVGGGSLSGGGTMGSMGACLPFPPTQATCLELSIIPFRDRVLYCLAQYRCEGQSTKGWDGISRDGTHTVGR